MPVQFEGEFVDVERLVFQDFNSDDGVGIAPNKHHAAAIRAFAARVHALPQPVEFVVHCKAGISRSAAVAKWVSETYGVKATGKPFNIGTSQANTLLTHHLKAIPADQEESANDPYKKKHWMRRLFSFGRLR